MSKPISDQTVLVTGAGRGLGAALARAFAAQGARVAINYRQSKEAAEALAAELGPQAQAFQADVTNPDQVRAMIAEIAAALGPVDTVVHNALADFKFDGDARGRLDTLGWDDFAAQSQVAVGGALNLVASLRPHFAAQHFGRVITIGSNLVQNPVVPYHDYTAAKAALLAFTRTASKDLGPDGITVTPEAVFDAIAAMTPLQQVTTPEDLAAAALFFASPWSRAVTGQNLIVDGGLVCG